MKRLPALMALSLLGATAPSGQLDPRLSSNSNARSVAIFFFVAGCPHNPHGVKDVNALVKMVGHRYSVYGITNLSYEDAKKYGKKLGANFRLEGDPNGKRIADFGAKHSLDAVVVTADGKITPFWDGYDRNVIAKIAATLPRPGTNDPKIKLDLAQFPKERQSGCGFPPAG